jgi:predicted ATP-grasp superfamily ATP-dependent carboligase
VPESSRRRAANAAEARSGEAQAWVLGAIDLVRALKLGGVPVVVIAGREDPARHSRSPVAHVDPADLGRGPEAMIERLLSLASEQREQPVLYYDNDADLLLVSRHRDRLAHRYRFVVASAQLVEDLVDKARFHALAARLGFPVPRTVQCSSRELGSDPGLRYPLVVKPVSRHGGVWSGVFDGKAIHVGDRACLSAIGDRLAGVDIELLVQEAVPGPESRIESYHVFVDDGGRIAGEFTGRKLRTWPRTYGFSTAVTITDDAEVRDLGRRTCQVLELRGVAKVDFKRDTDGALKLLEINPRFNLWHHPGALAGVNLPALVHAALLGHSLDAPPVVRPGVTWCSPHDLRAARAAGLGPTRWLRWVARCDAISGFSRDDPLPLPRAAFWRGVGRLRRRTEV